MESGVPVIASTVGGSPEIIEDAKNGILFDCDDAEALAQAIIALYKDRKYAASLGEAAYHDIRNRFSITNMVSNFEEAYKNIISK
jgi:glycosyltransferase involved in cell wall biosynthesis